MTNKDNQALLLSGLLEQRKLCVQAVIRTDVSGEVGKVEYEKLMDEIDKIDDLIEEAID